jgi:hypothetical protein
VGDGLAQGRDAAPQHQLGDDLLLGTQVLDRRLAVGATGPEALGLGTGGGSGTLTTGTVGTISPRTTLTFSARTTLAALTTWTARPPARASAV